MRGIVSAWRENRRTKKCHGEAVRRSGGLRCDKLPAWQAGATGRRSWRSSNGPGWPVVKQCPGGLVGSRPPAGRRVPPRQPWVEHRLTKSPVAHRQVCLPAIALHRSKSMPPQDRRRATRSPVACPSNRPKTTQPCRVTATCWPPPQHVLASIPTRVGLYPSMCLADALARAWRRALPSAPLRGSSGDWRL